MNTGMCTKLYPLSSKNEDETKIWYLNFKYEDKDEFFQQSY